MKIYLYIDNPDLDELAEPIEQAISAWLDTGEVNTKWVRLVNRSSESEEEANEHRVGDWDLGLVIQTNKKIYLKAPLNFLHNLAKEHEQECVVGRFDDETGEPENVCYFGFEEGRPDIHAIASYIGLEK